MPDQPTIPECRAWLQTQPDNACKDKILSMLDWLDTHGDELRAGYRFLRRCPELRALAMSKLHVHDATVRDLFEPTRRYQDHDDA